ncbi:MAG: type III polyketide synthase, partial [Actinomycetes bacterium]
NCSSATVLLVLERLAQTVDVPVGGTVVAMAFGPGLTVETALFTKLRQAPARASAYRKHQENQQDRLPVEAPVG